MCGRYVMARATSDLVALGDAETNEELVLRQSWNVAPTAEVPILVAHADDGGAGVTRRIHVARWGLVSPWAKGLSVGSRAFNARSETVASKPTFRAAVRARRCAVPVEGYYEWKTPEPGAKGPDGRAAKKQPYYVHPAGAGDGEGPVIWFAGLYEWWQDPEAKAAGEDAWVLSTTILTMAAPDADDDDPVLAALGRLHDRLPVPMDAETMGRWLAPDTLGSAEEADTLVGQVCAGAYDVAAGWSLRPVGGAVGNVRNNGPELTQEMREQQGTLL
ncbi:SOS response-associated peptidase [Micrococcus luteus]|uniref:SOS response-associated peptidase n=1 Tax=Micrococcus luteus TaxID=1270 RepID=UPI001021B6DD|nr:SOS response-associated peptidase [Micrococcus luteus]MCT2066726.1 SOS response-associated peptidase [Micrococcus luteus]MCV7462642.1 SOS response-associated peptidase [Micrococcus luteus]MCV7466997.1 SOS response-associated peptidase [Micrococcus luteus]MCV7473798.1 SOS response-associated peptidase [Micrococcus luteus]MCV7507127.1 SOS response-associated peptidase [Micrococcus luteus]